MGKIRNLFLKYREIISYLFFGVLTTVVSFGSFFIMNALIGKRFYIISQCVSWALSVAFAFVTNKLFVFEKTDNKMETIIKEGIKFTSVRIGTGVLELGLMILCVSFMKFNESISKIVVSFLVVILNYIFSKVMVFKKKRR